MFASSIRHSLLWELRSAPEFFEAGRVVALNEWLAFEAASPNEAADALAELQWVGDLGKTYLGTKVEISVGKVDLYCRQEAGWGVFFSSTALTAGPAG